MKVSVLICAAGASSRYGGKNKKQFTEMDGRAVFVRSIEAFSDRDDICQILLAIPAEDEEIFEIRWQDKLAFYGVKHVLGGKERHDTITNMLKHVQEDAELVALHDAVRPCVQKKKIDAVFQTAAKTGAAILAHRLVGTVKKVNDEDIITDTIDRSTLWEAQTPQVFNKNIIEKAYANRKTMSEQITDDAQLVEAMGYPVSVVESDSSNIKITNSTDIAIARAVLKSRPKPKKAGGPVGPWAGEQGW